MCAWTYWSPISRPNTYVQILKTLGAVFENVQPFYIYIQMYNLLWTIVVCGSDDAVASISQEDLARRLMDRQVQGLEVYTPASHHAMQVEYPYISGLRAKLDWVPLITDADPTIVDEIDLNQDSLRSQ